MNVILSQLIKFCGVSGLGWLMDIGLYTFFLDKLASPFICNMISSMVAITFIFFVATRKIFEKSNNIPLWMKYVAYVLYQFVLVSFVSYLILKINSMLQTSCGIELIVLYSKLIAKILITPITMTANFVVMRYIVEKL